MANKVEEKGVWRVRAAAWELLAFSFRYPGDELAEAVSSGEWADAATEITEKGLTGTPFSPVDASVEPVRPPAGGEERLELEEPATPEALLHSLRAEATRLFVGAPEAVASPYEGVWRAAEEGVQALLFVNPHSMDVERFMRACGLGQPAGTNEPLDHVATECELLQYLASLEADIVAPPEGTPAPADLPGGSPAAAYEAFLAEHARIWMPRFAEAVAAETCVLFYRAAALLLQAAVA